MANFVNRIPRGTRRYKGKTPLKCFNCGKIGHFSTKCPVEKNKKKINFEMNFKDQRTMDKKILFTKEEEEGISYFEEEESVEDNKNKISFIV